MTAALGWGLRGAYLVLSALTLAHLLAYVVAVPRSSGLLATRFRDRLLYGWFGTAALFAVAGYRGDAVLAVLVALLVFAVAVLDAVEERR